MRPHTHVFGWDEEPADERPSEFMPSSGYTALSGYHVPRDLSARAARRRTGHGFGAKMALAVCVALLVASGYALSEFAKLLH
ncbi:MAG TPA: hypothetical protein VJ743_21855 [Albitalea sp.]|nr:hypothetical protein [Albitalea sp.]